MLAAATLLKVRLALRLRSRGPRKYKMREPRTRDKQLGLMSRVSNRRV